MTAFTMTSPTTKGALPAGVTEIGGLVLDLVGLNGVRIVSQLSAKSLFEGTSTANTPIGTQSGFDAAALAALGGGLKEAAVRVTLDDGDSAKGDFDFHDNTLLLNGVSFGDFSEVSTQVTDSAGTTASTTQSGFPNNQLATGWFLSNNAPALQQLYASLVSQHSASFVLKDTDAGDNYLDFKQGLAGNLLDVGKPPVPVNQVPVIVHHDLSPALGACDTGATLGSDDLKATDADGQHLTYTVTSAPAGTLLIDGVIASGGATFSQADIDAGHVQLLAGPVLPLAAVSTPNGAISGAGISFADSFHFTVDDGAGGSTGGTFTAGYAPFDTVQTSAQYGGYWGGNGNDYQLGTAGSDNMSGGNGCDLMVGGAGNDQMHGNEGNNRVFGQDGDDNLTGGNGNDLLDGGIGNDQLHANGGNNVLIGGAGNDTMTAGEGDDRMFGGAGDDTLQANGGHNRIDGGAGNDAINVGNGNDVVIGGAGDDRISDNGGSNRFQLGGIRGAVSDGNDSFTTGAGADKFALFLNDQDGHAAGWGNDVINGFRIAEGDQLLAFNSQAGFWDNRANLGSLVDQGFVSGSRSADGGDLTLKFGTGAEASSVTMKWFFWDNAAYLSDAEKGSTFGQAITKDNLVGILEDAIQDGGSVGVGGSDFVGLAHKYIDHGFLL